MKLATVFKQQVMGASATQTFAVKLTGEQGILNSACVVAFFIKTASTSGTVTGTVESSPDNFTTLFELPFDFIAENGLKTGDAISNTAIGTAGNYIFVVHEAPSPDVRLKVVTSAASGATVDVWAVLSDDPMSIN